MSSTSKIAFYSETQSEPIASLHIPNMPDGDGLLDYLAYLDTVWMLEYYFRESWKDERQMYCVCPFLLEITLSEPVFKEIRLMNSVANVLRDVRRRLLYRPDMKIYNKWIIG